MPPTILLTGGLGFIGSHIAVELLQTPNNVIILDNLSNSKLEVLDKIKLLSKYPDNVHFYLGDVCNSSDIDNVFNSYNIVSVIHLASLKAVGESVIDPLKYYDCNINGLLTLLKVITKHQTCTKFIFSSSATVYGGSQQSPIKEDAIIGQNITNPYGQTKYFQEQILKDYHKTCPNMSITILRYFNPIGAHPSGLIGEDPNDIPNNLFPYLLKVSSGEYQNLTIFGDNYNTSDGTCIRDFIHIVDVALGHVAVINSNTGPINVYNLGTGRGTSVRDLINTFNRVNNIQLNTVVGDRRDGDIDVLYADASKIKNELNWTSKYTIEDSCRDGYHFYSKSTTTLPPKSL